MYNNLHNWSIYSLGDHAIVFALEEKIDPSIVNTINRLNAFIKSKEIPGVRDIIPSYHALTLVYDIIQFSNNSKNISDYLDEFSIQVLNEFDLIPTTYSNESNQIIRMPVCYELPFALDLENLSATKQIAVEEIIQIHTSKTYEVYSIGFLPGFAYMGIVDERISMPRHDKPRAQVLPGSVGIAGIQTGIYPLTSPGGWQIIGRTPITIFDPVQLALFAPGDMVSFYPISLDEFNSLQKETNHVI